MGLDGALVNDQDPCMQTWLTFEAQGFTRNHIGFAILYPQRGIGGNK